jgi:2-polyprenyl-6-methoxyphenol hydroxylase-like FAD-dependent oxidoreductase
LALPLITTVGSDVFIIGAGPAGLAAAIAARQLGLTVIVADGARPPIDKPCGEGLLPDSLAALQTLGIELSPSDGFPLRGIKFIDAKNSVYANLPGTPGIGLRRTILHQRMTARALAIGVKFLWGTPVTGFTHRSVHLAGEKTINSRWIVAADGSQSRLRRWAGLDSRRRVVSRIARRAHFAVAPWFEGAEVHWCGSAQAYVTPVSPNEICVVVASAETARRPAELKSASAIDMDLSQFPLLMAQLKNSSPAGRERGAVATMCSLRRVYRENVALIGDASGSVDVITGEGLSLAFRQATALAAAMAAENLEIYQAAHRRIARRPAFIGRLLLLLAAHPYLREITLATFARQPKIFERLVAFHVGELSATASTELGPEVRPRYVEA